MNPPTPLSLVPSFGDIHQAYPRQALMNIAMRPFQYPSLEHLDERVEAVMLRAADVDGVRPSTIRWYRDGYRSLRAFVVASHSERGLLGGDFIQQQEVLTQWRASLLRSGLARVSIRTYWRSVVSIFQRIQRQDGMVNPCLWMTPPRVGRVLPKSLTRDAARTIMLFVQNHDWESSFTKRRNTAVLGCMLLSGLRRSEVVNLRNADVDEKQGTIFIHAGKGRDGGKDRTAYMPPQLQEIIALYRVERRKRVISTASFFVSGRRDAPWGVGGMKSLFRTISTRTGIHVSPHRLRHTFATLLRQSGVPDRVSMDLLGHAQLSTLQRYSHVFETEYTQEIKKLSVDVS
jgi:integrase/recombinase XerD